MEKKKLKYPVILVHGIAAKDNNLFWGRIPETLRSAGIDVFLGNTDSWSGIERNALLLKESVDSALEKCGTEKVNLIAHSKGGIDSRFLISTLGYAPKIASLTTISTPHLGSEIVDFVYNKKYIHSKLAKAITNSLVRLYGDKSPELHTMLGDLNTKNMIKFNLQNPDANSVYYSSYQSFIMSGFDDLSHFLTYYLIKRVSGANDGVVSLKSSKWGDNCTLIKGLKWGGISHSEIVDIKRRKISGVDVPAEYLNIVDMLISKGF
ncbi:alpha/beta fold hydrolase [Bacteroides sp. 51]|uniref:lipase family alpha/beta hydrolase n=1 Tax=Bacteroides sp. 51 TaxID=2302938 RepID=UPI0013D7EA03|nr:alpha/beta fold hydrolase [Bacteroides sp. 51]